MTSVKFSYSSPHTCGCKRSAHFHIIFSQIALREILVKDQAAIFNFSSRKLPRLKLKVMLATFNRPIIGCASASSMDDY